jgi:hypothetical protein
MSLSVPCTGFPAPGGGGHGLFFFLSPHVSSGSPSRRLHCSELQSRGSVQEDGMETKVAVRPTKIAKSLPRLCRPLSQVY